MPVQNHANLVKIDGAYVVNEDDTAYKAALARREQSRKQKQMETRVDALEGKLDLILQLLQQGK